MSDISSSDGLQLRNTILSGLISVLTSPSSIAIKWVRGSNECPPPADDFNDNRQKNSYITYGTGLFAQWDTAEDLTEHESLVLETDHRIYNQAAATPDAANIKSFSALHFRDGLIVTPIPNGEVAGRPTNAGVNAGFCDYYIDAVPGGGCSMVWQAENECNSYPELEDFSACDVVLGSGLAGRQVTLVDGTPVSPSQLYINTNHTIGSTTYAADTYTPPIADVDCDEFGCLIFGKGITVELADSRADGCDYLIEATAGGIWDAANDCCDVAAFADFEPEKIVLGGGLCATKDQPEAGQLKIETTHSIGNQSDAGVPNLNDVTLLRSWLPHFWRRD